MGEQGIDLLAVPAATGVGPANADCDPDACRAAWRRGIEHSTGGFTVRHLGLPTVTVTMGQMPTTRMPVGITFASTAYRDADVISAAYAFEQAGDRRRRPVLTDLARLSC
jgi:amidase